MPADVDVDVDSLEATLDDWLLVVEAVLAPALFVKIRLVLSCSSFSLPSTSLNVMSFFSSFIFPDVLSVSSQVPFAVFSNVFNVTVPSSAKITYASYPSDL